MADDERALGGYSPDAGRNAHEAGAPTLIPVPSLLRSLLSEHLDPGYAAAAERRSGRRHPRAGLASWGWQLLAGLAVAAVFAAAAAQAQSVAPATRETSTCSPTACGSAEAGDDRRHRAPRRAGRPGRGRTPQPPGGRRAAAGSCWPTSTPPSSPRPRRRCAGPGLTVTVTEPGAARDLSDVSKQRVAGSRR